MGQRARLKKDRKSVKGVAIRKNSNQDVTVKQYGNVTSVEIKSGGKKSGSKKSK